MAERKLKVFLCHSSGDKPTVRDLYQRLLADGFEPWLDEEDLLPGQHWELEIPRAVRAADAILVCLSHDSINKEGYVQKEIKEALDVADEKPEGVIFFIPARLEPCDLPTRLKRWQAVNLYEERGYGRLLRALQARTGSLGVLVSPSQEPTLQKKAELQKVWTNSIGMEFVLIPAGEFQMGSESGFDNEKPVHLVRITKPFYLGKYQVTQGQWETVMGNNPSRFKGDPNCPVEMVSWEDAQLFLQQLNEQKSGKGYRLPTEAEWEYAARAGSTGAYCFGDDVSQLQEYAWYAANAEGTTHPVGQLKPNAWGLYDMHGNVWEWCHDGVRSYTSASVADPRGPTTKGANRVIRGGLWRWGARRVRSAFRDADHPGYRVVYLGFRCASSG
ncbi:MAG: SUMF1/EgtB/PvdO family nonheme iron enzyme [Candidatus Binatia bacterium]